MGSISNLFIVKRITLTVLRTYIVSALLWTLVTLTLQHLQSASDLASCCFSLLISSLSDVIWDAKSPTASSPSANCRGEGGSEIGSSNFSWSILETNPVCYQATHKNDKSWYNNIIFTFFADLYILVRRFEILVRRFVSSVGECSLLTGRMCCSYLFSASSRSILFQSLLTNNSCSCSKVFSRSTFSFLS